LRLLPRRGVSIRDIDMGAAFSEGFDTREPNGLSAPGDNRHTAVEFEPFEIHVVISPEE
jgi:hypothetical protein